jgi:Ca2+-binding RTX toxin-like protein
LGSGPFSLLLISLLSAVLALGVPKLSERGANLRKAVLLTLGAMITTLVMGGGVAWAVKVIHCPNSPKDPQTCTGTDRKDIMHGTSERDVMRAGRERDTLYGRAGPDALSGNGGPDTIYGGQGNDRLLPGCDFDSWCGKDEKHGDQGDDFLGGNLKSEKHFGGSGNDKLIDNKSSNHSDVFSCGPGYDRVYYNKGLDRVADDCEKLWAAR